MKEGEGGVLAPLDPRLSVWYDKPFDLPGGAETVPLELCLVPCGDLRDTKSIDPLADRLPACLEFAGLSSHEDYRAFANTYGLLGIPASALQDARLPGEPLSIWADEAKKIRNVLGIWAFLQGKKPGWEAIYASKTAAVATSPRDRMKIYGESAAQRLAETLTLNMRRVVTAGVRFGQHDRRPQFSVDYEPTNLLGVLWLQCAWIVTRRQDFRRCVRSRCGGWLAIGRDHSRPERSKRSHTQFCSDVCRAAHRQELIADIRRRRKRGESIALIASDMRMSQRRIRTLAGRAGKA